MKVIRDYNDVVKLEIGNVRYFLGKNTGNKKTGIFGKNFDSKILDVIYQVGTDFPEILSSDIISIASGAVNV